MPIWFIDGAFKLEQILRHYIDRQGNESLKYFFDFFVRITKQNQWLHMILTSDNSIYPQVSAAVREPGDFNAYVDGDLSEHAKPFWK